MSTQTLIRILLNILKHANNTVPWSPNPQSPSNIGLPILNPNANISLLILNPHLKISLPILNPAYTIYHVLLCYSRYWYTMIPIRSQLQRFPILIQKVIPTEKAHKIQKTASKLQTIYGISTLVRSLVAP